MRIKLLNTELFIKANHLKEIRNPIILDPLMDCFLRRFLV